MQLGGAWTKDCALLAILRAICVIFTHMFKCNPSPLIRLARSRLPVLGTNVPSKTFLCVRQLNTENDCRYLSI